MISRLELQPCQGDGVGNAELELNQESSPRRIGQSFAGREQLLSLRAPINRESTPDKWVEHQPVLLTRHTRLDDVWSQLRQAGYPAGTAEVEFFQPAR